MSAPSEKSTGITAEAQDLGSISGIVTPKTPENSQEKAPEVAPVATSAGDLIKQLETALVEIIRNNTDAEKFASKLRNAAKSENPGKANNILGAILAAIFMPDESAKEAEQIKSQVFTPATPAPSAATPPTSPSPVLGSTSQDGKWLGNVPPYEAAYYNNKLKEGGNISLFVYDQESGTYGLSRESYAGSKKQVDSILLTDRDKEFLRDITDPEKRERLTKLYDTQTRNPDLDKQRDAFRKMELIADLERGEFAAFPEMKQMKEVEIAAATSVPAPATKALEKATDALEIAGGAIGASTRDGFVSGKEMREMAAYVGRLQGSDSQADKNMLASMGKSFDVNGDGRTDNSDIQALVATGKLDAKAAGDLAKVFAKLNPERGHMAGEPGGTVSPNAGRGSKPIESSGAALA